jgi:hypothetical protein
VIFDSGDTEWIIELNCVPIARLVDPVHMPYSWTSWRLVPLTDIQDLFTSGFFVENDDALMFSIGGERFKPHAIPFFPSSQNGRIMVQRIPRTGNPRRIRIHLSTALVMMLVMGGFVGLNTHVAYSKAPNIDDNLWARMVSRGWPVPLSETLEVFDLHTATWQLAPIQPPQNFIFFGLLVNICCAAFVAVFVAAICEYLIERRRAIKL